MEVVSSDALLHFFLISFLQGGESVELDFSVRIVDSRLLDSVRRGFFFPPDQRDAYAA